MEPTISPEDVKWLKNVREKEAFGRKGRPLPFVVQSRLRSMGWIELRRGKLVLTARGLQVLTQNK